MYKPIQNKMTHGEFKKKVTTINKLFQQLEEKLHSLPNGLQIEMIDYHNSEGTVEYCVRWGLQASEEILADSKKVYDRAKENYDI